MTSAVDFDAMSAHWARRLEVNEATRLGVPICEARASLARRIGITVGALERLRNGRVSGVRAWIVEKLRSAIIRDIEREIAAAKHDLEIAMAMGIDARSPHMASLEAAVHRAIQMIEDMAQSGDVEAGPIPGHERKFHGKVTCLSSQNLPAAPVAGSFPGSEK